jgi:hypothetical protein
MPPIRGSCLCGGVTFEITGPLLAPMNCHCSQCRKQHGAAFRSRVRVAAADLRFLSGEYLIKFWESPRGYQRGFCSECGSPIINRTGPNWKAPAAFPDGPAAIRRRAGPARQPASDARREARAALLHRQQGALVRDHRRPAAIRGISPRGVISLVTTRLVTSIPSPPGLTRLRGRSRFGAAKARWSVPM